MRLVVAEYVATEARSNPGPGDGLHAHDREPSSPIATGERGSGTTTEQMRAQPIDILPDPVHADVIKRWLPDKGYMIDLLR